MRYAGYVITGWTLTAVVLGFYWARLVIRTRRARRIVDADQTPR